MGAWAGAGRGGWGHGRGVGAWAGAAGEGWGHGTGGRCARATRPRPLAHARAPPCPTRSPPCSYGDVKSAEPSTFLGVYQLYFFFPFLVIARLAMDRPFTRALPSGRAAALWFYGSVTFAVFFSYVAKWLVVHMPGELPAGLVALMMAAKQLP